MAEVFTVLRACRAATVIGIAAAVVACAGPPARVGLASHTPVAAPVDGPPEVNLSGALLYQIMAAEVALQPVNDDLRPEPDWNLDARDDGSDLVHVVPIPVATRESPGSDKANGLSLSNQAEAA